VFPPGDAREDWSILRALSDALGARLPYDSLTELRAALAAAHPHLVRFDRIVPADPAALRAAAALAGAVERAPFRSAIEDFYLTNPIARASRVMAECSALARERARQAAE
jgi:NADH-quinone oxidoreductase subunit G